MFVTTNTNPNFDINGLSSLALNQNQNMNNNETREAIETYINDQLSIFDQEQRSNMMNVFINTSFITAYMIVAFWSIAFAVRFQSKTKSHHFFKNSFEPPVTNLLPIS